MRLKQKSVQRKGQKITAAVYAYQVDNGGEWGEIQFNLVEKSAWVEVFADNDSCDSWEITAYKPIKAYILEHRNQTYRVSG